MHNMVVEVEVLADSSRGGVEKLEAVQVEHPVEGLPFGMMATSPRI